MENIVLGGGCFWCLEATFQLIQGVEEVTPGYSGGHTINPTYEDVYEKDTGHAEVVKIKFDNKKIILKQLLDIFWIIHDPTTINRQGADIGSQYRSIILYNNEIQLSEINESIKNVQKVWSNRIVTEVSKLKIFYEAEDYHKNYFINNPDKAYCQIVINPKLDKLKTKFKLLLK